MWTRRQQSVLIRLKWVSERSAYFSFYFSVIVIQHTINGPDTFQNKKLKLSWINFLFFILNDHIEYFIAGKNKYVQKQNQFICILCTNCRCLFVYLFFVKLLLLFDVQNFKILKFDCQIYIFYIQSQNIWQF